MSSKYPTWKNVTWHNSRGSPWIHVRLCSSCIQMTSSSPICDSNIDTLHHTFACTIYINETRSFKLKNKELYRTMNRLFTSSICILKGKMFKTPTSTSFHWKCPERWLFRILLSETNVAFLHLEEEDIALSHSSLNLWLWSLLSMSCMKSMKYEV